jgi:hypothetical protein
MNMELHNFVFKSRYFRKSYPGIFLKIDEIICTGNFQAKYLKSYNIIAERNVNLIHGMP